MPGKPSKRQIKSFSHSVLVEYLLERGWFYGASEIDRLVTIERQQRSQRLLDRMKAISEELKEVHLPQDFKRWHALHTEWDHVQEEFDKLYPRHPIEPDDSAPQVDHA